MPPVSLIVLAAALATVPFESLAVKVSHNFIETDDIEHFSSVWGGHDGKLSLPPGEDKDYRPACVPPKFASRVREATGTTPLDDGDVSAIMTTMFTSTTKKHADYFYPEVGKQRLADGDVGFVFLNTNPDAEFVHGDTHVPVVAGSLVTFEGRVPHHTIVQSGTVRIAGPFHVDSLAFVGRRLDSTGWAGGEEEGGGPPPGSRRLSACADGGSCCREILADGCCDDCDCDQDHYCDCNVEDRHCYEPKLRRALELRQLQESNECVANNVCGQCVPVVTNEDTSLSCPQPDDPNTHDGSPKYTSISFLFEGDTWINATTELSDYPAKVSFNGNTFDFDLHMSCSDTFEGGYGNKGGPFEEYGHPRVLAWNIWKYDEFKSPDDASDVCEFKKTCGGPFDPTEGESSTNCPAPGDPNELSDKKSISFQFDNGQWINTTTDLQDFPVTLDEQPGVVAFYMHLSCSDTFDDGYGNKGGPIAEEGHPKVVSWNIWEYDHPFTSECTIKKACGTESSTNCPAPDDPNELSDKKSISFEFDNGQWINTTTDLQDFPVTLDGQPGVVAFYMHLSCSDTFDGGYGNKGGPLESEGHPRVVSWNIWEYKDPFTSECTIYKGCGTESSTNCPAPDDPNELSDKKSISFQFDTGDTVQWINDTTDLQDYPVTLDGHTFEMHLSCSDTFDGGYGNKGGPLESEGHPRVVSWNIWEYNDPFTSECTIYKGCGTESSTICPAPGDPNELSHNSKSISFQFETDHGVDWFNTTTDLKDYHVTLSDDVSFKLHLSCSDTFEDGYGNHGGPKPRHNTRVVSWNIWEYEDPFTSDCKVKKACGTESSTICPAPGDPNELSEKSASISFKLETGQWINATTNLKNYPVILDGHSGVAFNLHLSCSDTFEDGYGNPDKGGPFESEGHPRVVSWNIWKYDNPLTSECTIKKVCGGDFDPPRVNTCPTEARKFRG